MSNVILMSSYERMKDYRFPRTMREANIDHLPWEHTKPIKPFWILPALILFSALVWFGVIRLAMWAI